MTWLVASDWHLGPWSPPGDGPLALAFLARVRAAGATAILAGDVFEALFAGPGRAEAAHPAVAREVEALAAAGRLVRLCGNHDPAAGPEHLLLDVPGVGRVLVAHGHAADPLHASLPGRLGDAVSARLGTLAAVRGAAHLAEAAARTLAGPALAARFRARCLDLVRRERADLGVFGHVHVPHLLPGDLYVNAGALLGGRLRYAVLDGAGVRLAVLTPEDG